MPSKILIIDDDVEMTMVMQDILKLHNYEVVTASDGLQGIEKADQEDADLILLDIRMPQFSGFWFCDAYFGKPRAKTVPIVVVSAFSDQATLEKAYQMGAFQHLTKPFRAAELIETVEKALRSPLKPSFSPSF